MFICRACHLKVFGTPMEDVHFRGSFGPCEHCRLSGSCADCKCAVSVKNSRPMQSTKQIVDRFIDQE